MKVGLIIICIWSAVLLLLSLLIAGICGFFEGGSLDLFMLPFPFILAAALVVYLTVKGLYDESARVKFFYIAVPLHGFLFVPFYFVLRHWPGGADGTGMVWMFLIGGGSCIAGALAVVLTFIGIIITIRKKK